MLSPPRAIVHLLLFFLSFSPWVLSQGSQQRLGTEDGPSTGGGVSLSSSNHTNNWAVLVSASRYWFNYRHMANALGMYRTVKRLGIPDSNIILMLADDTACNPRNHFPGAVYADSGRNPDLYGDNIEVDYRGYEVTVENVIRLLTGRVDPSVPRSKRLLTDARSNIFVYLTGHGGVEFLKFQDNEEISAYDLADAFEQMWQKKRYNELLFMIDTCQANTMYSKIYSPNILTTGSSDLGENSYSYENDNDIGVAVIDSFTHHVLQFMEGINKTSHTSMQDLFDSYQFESIHSHAGVRTDLFNRPLTETLLTDFFGGVAQVGIIPNYEEGQDVTEKVSDSLDISEESDTGEREVVYSATENLLATLRHGNNDVESTSSPEHGKLLRSDNEAQKKLAIGAAPIMDNTFRLWAAVLLVLLLFGLAFTRN